MIFGYIALDYIERMNERKVFVCMFSIIMPKGFFKVRAIFGIRGLGRKRIVTVIACCRSIFCKDYIAG